MKPSIFWWLPFRSLPWLSSAQAAETFDAVLAMTVTPGFGGQAFMHEVPVEGGGRAIMGNRSSAGGEKKRKHQVLMIVKDDGIWKHQVFYERF